MKIFNFNVNIKVLEIIIIFSSIIKWVSISSLIGIIVATSTFIFLKTLDFGIKITTSYNSYYLFMPIAFFISSFLVNKLAPDAEGHGTEKVIESIHKHNGRINIKVVPVKLLATIITIISGGSAGKEGPSAQIGATLASYFSEKFKFNNIDKKKIVICGISAGFAAVFGTPIAGAIFAIEVLSIGKIFYNVILPSIISATVAFEFSNYLGIEHFHSNISFSSKFTLALFVKTIFSGIFFGLVSLSLIEINNFFKKLSEKINIYPPLKGILGGGLLVFITLIFSNKYLGLGMDVILNSIKGNENTWYSFIIKIVTTCITLNFGGSGGILTPIFFIGATSGSFFANIFSLDMSMFSAIGLVALLSASANTPIAACIMSMEMFGSDITTYSAMACIISFMMVGHRSVYPSQQLSFTKSSSLNVEFDSEIELINNSLKYKENSFINKAKDIKDKFSK
ncbi:MAG: chloride channel protein [Candidatus Sericytochromatia bacterium]